MIIDAENDMKVIGAVDNGREAANLAQQIQPDVIIMDISTPELNGLKAATELIASASNIKILILTRHTDKAYLKELLQVGVSGYILKQSEPDELIRAIRAVAGGGKYLDPAITDNVLNIFTIKQSKQRGDIVGDPLSDRESEVLRLIARGYTNKEISAMLQTNVKTIETQKATALRKLNISRRNEIVDYAILQGWLRES